MSAATHVTHFGDAVIERVRALGHPLCVGLDPHLARIPSVFRRAQMRPDDPETAEAVREFLFALLDRIAGRVAVVKPQIALFEALGWRGIRVLREVVDQARAVGLLVLMDAKRSDIGSSAEGYARAYLDEGAPLPSDALTVNPYLGMDTLEPFLDRARGSGKGLFVLVKTSNPGSGDFQDQMLTGRPLFMRVAERLAPVSEALCGPRTGWSALGAVAGATHPAAAEAVRAALPKAIILVPGYGAQGGSAMDAVRVFMAGPAGREGGLVNSSRAVLFPEPAHDADARDWDRIIDEHMERAIDELSDAVAS
ncbi:MAG: orotidine-5'-phosphate decarboxylase [Myxococcales bacterium]|nr:orotidine-5'-phosphate decarboxylase [Myxococcales bacterium]